MRSRSRRARGRILGLVVVVAALGTLAPACSRSDDNTILTENTPPARAAAGESLVAEARHETLDVFEAPGRREPMLTLDNPLPSGAPRVLLVTEDQGPWLEVLLPVRPNGTTGFVRDVDVKLTKHDYRVVVELTAHRLTAYQGNQPILQEPVGVGKETTPTPGGLYYTIELLEQPDPDGDYGPYAYGLSGYSEVLTEFSGGDGELGLHGTNEPSSLGNDVSAGCIRLSNPAIEFLATRLPLGTPVQVER